MHLCLNSSFRNWFENRLFSLKNRPICCCAFKHLFVPLVRTNSQRAVSRSNVKSLRNKQKKVTALGMALTKYVSAFPFLNMMYLEFPFSFQRCHPFMWALSLQPNMTQIYNIIGHITVLTIWLINLMPFNPPKKVRFLCEVFLNVGRHHAFHIMNTFKSYPTTFLYSFGWSILQGRHHPYKTSLHLYFLKIIIDCLAMENGDIQ